MSYEGASPWIYASDFIYTLNTHIVVELTWSYPEIFSLGDSFVSVLLLTVKSQDPSVWVKTSFFLCICSPSTSAVQLGWRLVKLWEASPESPAYFQMLPHFCCFAKWLFWPPESVLAPEPLESWFCDADAGPSGGDTSLMPDGTAPLTAFSLQITVCRRMGLVLFSLAPSESRSSIAIEEHIVQTTARLFFSPISKMLFVGDSKNSEKEMKIISIIPSRVS